MTQKFKKLSRFILIFCLLSPNVFAETKCKIVQNFAASPNYPNYDIVKVETDAHHVQISSDTLLGTIHHLDLAVQQLNQYRSNGVCEVSEPYRLNCYDFVEAAEVTALNKSIFGINDSLDRLANNKSINNADQQYASAGIAGVTLVMGSLPFFVVESVHQRKLINDTNKTKYLIRSAHTLRVDDQQDVVTGKSFEEFVSSVYISSLLQPFAQAFGQKVKSERVARVAEILRELNNTNKLCKVYFDKNGLAQADFLGLTDVRKLVRSRLD